MIDDAPASQKAALRRRLRARRKRLAAEAPLAAEQAAALLPRALLARFSKVAGYRPAGAEIDPWPLMARFAAAGAALALPRADSPDAVIVFRAYAAGDALAPDAHGIGSPLATAPECLPDLVIVPLLGFDDRGGRIGQGGGHYDRALAAARSLRPVFALGLAFSGQQTDEIVLETHDQRLDAILTEKGYIEVRKDP